MDSSGHTETGACSGGPMGMLGVWGEKSEKLAYSNFLLSGSDVERRDTVWRILRMINSVAMWENGSV